MKGEEVIRRGTYERTLCEPTLVGRKVFPKAFYADFEVSMFIRGRKWSCKTGLGGRKVFLRLNFFTKQEESAPKCTYGDLLYDHMADNKGILYVRKL